MNEVNFDSFVEELEIPKLTKDKQHLMEHDLSIKEIKNAIKQRCLASKQCSVLDT